MKFLLNQSDPRRRIAVPPPARKLSGLDGESALEIHALDGAIVITKARMTAMDMIKTIWSLSSLVTDMSARLGAACGDCTGCGFCECIDPDNEAVRLPDYVLEEAGLPPGCKLTAAMDEDGIITVFEADYDYDLTDVPPSLLEIFRGANVCLNELEERLMGDDIVYNGGGDDGGDDNDF